ncbi:tyrosine-type recombinase/integrase [Pseudescherichia sp.]|uniref:tyrosine-type recombinase/integrase n=1 Tax=Pseudescherichia sp. TaxID=2055881 RepID=UPI00289DCF56|nr:tyrosine-type recombinase/integrase [Pseudescherichia sp.]
MKHQEFYNSAVRTFIVNNPEACWDEMKEYLRDLAESLLMDKPDEFWDGVEVSTIDDSREALMDLVATAGLSLNQHKAIIKAQEILKATKERLCGNAGPLLALVEEFSPAVESLATSVALGPLAPLPLSVSQVASPAPVLTFDDLYQKYLAENSINMKKSTISDHNTIRRRLSEYIAHLNMGTYTREDMTELRADLIESGNYADASVNKILQKVSAVVNWGVNNGLVQYDYTKGLKLKGVRNNRRAFTDPEMSTLITALTTDKNLTLAQQWAIRVGMITGVRIGELLQLTKVDIQEQDGITFIDIHDNNAKGLKNKASIRKVPLTDGAYGFSLDKFRAWLERQRDGEDIFREHSRTYSDLNAFIKRHTTSTGEVSFHSLRHYMATRARARGVSEADVGGILGHASGEVTFGVYGASVSMQRSSEVLKVVLL